MVSVWAGHEAEAIKIFASLPSTPRPNYVIKAVALAYRHIKQPTDALALYREGLRRSPNNLAFTDGEIRATVDLGQFSQAIALAETDLRLNGEWLDVLLAAGYAASAQKLPVEALRYIDRALAHDPASSAARHDRIMAIDEVGRPKDRTATRRANSEFGLGRRTSPNRR